jgi:hypothetical protein
MLSLPKGLNKIELATSHFNFCKSIVPHPMKTLLLSFLFLVNATCKESSTVYVCNNGSGKKYHLRSGCRGLSNCNHQLISISLEKARHQGKTLCKWEK